MSIEIIKYIHKHVLNMKNNEIDSNLRHVKLIDKNINKYVDDIMEKHPSLVSHVINRQQSGGTLLDENTKQKLSKISAVFSAYNSIKLDEVVIKAKNIEIELDNIIKKVGSIKEADKLEVTQTSESILNNLDIIKTDTQKFKDGISLNIKKNRLYVPIVDPLANLSEYSISISSIFSDIKADVEKYTRKINSLEAPDANAFDEIYDKIRKMYKSTQKINNEIAGVLLEVKKANDEIEKLIQYDSSENIIKIDKLDVLVNKIKTIVVNNDDMSGFELFRANFMSLWVSFTNKEIKERDVLYWYNDNITQQIASTYNLPLKYFDGRFTQRIPNNFLLKESDIDQKLEVLRTMIDEPIGSTDIKSFVEIINPDFKTMKQQANVANKLPTIGIGQIIGGTKSLNDVTKALVKLDNEMKIFYEEHDKYKKDISVYNVLQLRLLTHTLFQTLIVTNQLFETDHVVYNYINVGTLTFYQRIIITILNKIKNNDRSDKILYFNKYHHMTLQKLKIFIDNLVMMVEPDDIIDIRECKGEVANRFLLLNYFKDILESYNETDMNVITIYARINDIRDPIKYDQSRFLDYMKQKMFFSDYDRKMIKSNSEFNAIIAGSSQSNLEYIESDNLDTTLMYVSTNSCDNLKNDFLSQTTKQYPQLEPLNQYKFTEVFDSIKFPDNGSISKYMTLDTQIAKGKGVAIMTYGYSGTGKTYTLFGSKSSGKQGILQSTLDNITGLKWVKFRLFELYGHGLTYPHYWSSEVDGKPRTNEIEHKIFAYNMELTTDSLKLSTPATNQIDSSGNQIKTYIDKHSALMGIDTHDCTNSSYTFVAGNMISNVFSNFDEFMDTVEKERKDTGRIRDTPNNIVSSRSVLIYDFIIRVGDKNVPFVILDLPGREEIVASYIDPFLSNPHILSLLQLDENSNETLQLRLLLVTMALNPIAVPIFAPDLVFDFINNINHDKLNEILTKPIDMKYEINMQSSHYFAQPKHNVIEANKKYYINKVNMRGFTYFEELINTNGTELSHVVRLNSQGKLEINGFSGHAYYSSSDCDAQYKALAGIHFINRLIMSGHFDILENMFKLIVDNKINIPLKNAIDGKTENAIKSLFTELQQSGFKGELLNNEQNKSAESLKKLIIYDYYLTPLEGIYINENIAGLIKFLASNEKMIPDEKIRSKFIDKLKKDMLQPQGLDFQYQQKTARVWLSVIEKIQSAKDIENLKNFYLFNKSDIMPSPMITGNNGDKANCKLIYDDEKMIEGYDKMTNSYVSKKIFSFDYPLITDILKPYVNEIKDYKVFYLFGNYTGQENEKLKNLKCEHQYSLLENTSDFINVIVSPLKQ